MKELFLGVSEQDWYSERLFNYVEDYQGTDKTLLQHRFRWSLSGKERIVGIPITLHADGSVNPLYVSLAYELWEKNEHCAIIKHQPKIYTLGDE